MFGPYCLVDGLAVNCYVDPVYTLDVELVMTAAILPELAAHLQGSGLRRKSMSTR